MEEFLLYYLYFPIIYVPNLFYWAIYEPLWMLGWLILGVAALYFFIASKKPRYVFILFVVFWFMPGTIICGGAAMIPWPISFISAFDGGGCTPVVNLVATFILNLAIVYSAYFIYKKIKSRKYT